MIWYRQSIFGSDAQWRQIAQISQLTDPGDGAFVEGKHTFVPLKSFFRFAFEVVISTRLYLVSIDFVVKLKQITVVLTI